MNVLMVTQHCQKLTALFHCGLQLKVHSIYTHVCNLEVISPVQPHQLLVTLGSAHLFLGPNGMIIDNAQFDVLQKNKQLTYDSLFNVELKSDPYLGHSSCILISDKLTIDLSHSQSLSTQFIDRISYLNQNNHNALLLQQIDCFLKEKPPTDGIYQILNGASSGFSKIMLDLIMPYFIQLSKLLQFNRSDEIENNSAHFNKELNDLFIHLVGFGIGLTPSADDFILGILMVLQYVHSPIERPFSHGLLEVIHRTTDISQQMLRHGCHGHFSLLFISLFHDVPLNNHSKLQQIANYGHSSGHDMLCGIAFCLRFHCVDI